MSIELLIRLVQVMLELCCVTLFELILFTYVALNCLDICAGDVQNTYLQPLSLEKYYIICGPGFGIN